MNSQLLLNMNHRFIEKNFTVVYHLIGESNGKIKIGNR